MTDGNIGVYFANLGVKGSLVIELTDVRIKKVELDTIVATGGFSGSGNIHIRGVGGELGDGNSAYCIELESNSENCDSGTHNGSPIAIFHNNIEKATIPSKFEQFSFCLPVNYVNIINDKFKLHMRKRDDVSFFISFFQLSLRSNYFMLRLNKT